MGHESTEATYGQLPRFGFWKYLGSSHTYKGTGDLNRILYKTTGTSALYKILLSRATSP